MPVTGPAEPDDALLDEALSWYRALEADDTDWDGYTRWFEADPRHRTAFDQIALTDRIVDEHIERLRSIALVEPDRRRRSSRPWLVGAIAAALAAVVGLPMALRSTPDVTYEAARQARHIALPGGIAVDLAPGSTLVASAGDANRLALTRGEAYFDVTHDPARTLAIRAGDYAITDIGTTFGVNLSGRTVLVSVSTGQVAVDPPGAATAVTVSVGQQLLGSRDADTTTVATVPGAGEGSWRQGRLTYSDVPLTIVASDIARYVGKPVVVDTDIAERRFSGVLKVGDGSELLPTLVDVMALSTRVEGDRVRLSARPAR